MGLFKNDYKVEPFNLDTPRILASYAPAIKHEVEKRS